MNNNIERCCCNMEDCPGIKDQNSVDCTEVNENGECCRDESRCSEVLENKGE